MTQDHFAPIARELSSGPKPRVRPQGLHCYVALGDSFTAGTGCPSGSRWADALAAGLLACNPHLDYRNLAFDGATSADVLEQLADVVQLEPDLATVVCGANDVLRSTRPDALAYAWRLSRIVGRLRNAMPGVIVVTATSPEEWDFVRVGPRTRKRIEAGMRRFNRVTLRVAQLHGIACLDVAGHPGLRRRENFASDGLHPSVQGHARAAQAFARVLREEHRIPIRPLEGEPA